jgi:hypothetical protein
MDSGRRLGLTTAPFKPKPHRCAEHRRDRPEQHKQQQQPHRGAPITPLRAILGSPRAAAVLTRWRVCSPST